MLESTSASETLEYLLNVAIRDGLIVRYQTDWSATAVLVKITFPADRYHRVSAAALSRDWVRLLAPWKLKIDIQSATDAPRSPLVYEYLHRLRLNW